MVSHNAGSYNTRTCTRSHNTKRGEREASARGETEKGRGEDRERKKGRANSYSSHIVLALWPICQTEHIRKTDDLTGAVDRLLQSV